MRDFCSRDWQTPSAFATLRNLRCLAMATVWTNAESGIRVPRKSHGFSAASLPAEWRRMADMPQANTEPAGFLDTRCQSVVLSQSVNMVFKGIQAHAGNHS